MSDVIMESELEGLPDELLKELHATRGGKQERVIIACIKRIGGVANLDQILIDLYRHDHVILKRSVITSLAYRLCLKGKLRRPKNTQGIYALVTQPNVSQGD